MCVYIRKYFWLPLQVENALAYQILSVIFAERSQLQMTDVA